MFDYDSQLKLQAFLDGELPSGDARKVELWLAQEADAQALLGELRATRAALAGFDTGVQLPETREFYWSKIKREIQRQPPAESASPTVPFLVRVRRFLIPASAVAVLMVAGLVALGPYGGSSRLQGPELEATQASPGAFTYRDHASGTTLVWLSFPAENDLAEPDDSEEAP
jgi:anti-sigma factor RsiW